MAVINGGHETTVRSSSLQRMFCVSFIDVKRREGDLVRHVFIAI